MERMVYLNEDRDQGKLTGLYKGVFKQNISM